MFGDDDLEARMKEVRQEWQEAVSSISGQEAYVCSECGRQFGSEAEVEDHVREAHSEEPGGGPSAARQVGREWEVISSGAVEALDLSFLSPTQLAAYMGLTFLYLILLVVFGGAHLLFIPLNAVVGGWLAMKGKEGNHLAMFLTVILMVHAGTLLLVTLGVNFTLLAALSGIGAFILALTEGAAIRELGAVGRLTFHAISAVIVPIWALSLINVVLSILTVNFVNLGFLAMVLASIGTSAYLFTGGNIADAFGVYRGIGLGLTRLYERVLIGHELHGEARLRGWTAVLGSAAIFVYALTIAANQAVPRILRNPLFLFVFGMLGPFAFWHYLTRAEEIQQYAKRGVQRGVQGGAAAVGTGVGVAKQSLAGAAGRVDPRSGGAPGNGGGGGQAAAGTGSSAQAGGDPKSLPQGEELTLAVRRVGNRAGQLDLQVEDSQGYTGTLYGDPARWARQLAISEDEVWDYVDGATVRIRITDPTNTLWPRDQMSHTIWAGSYDILEVNR